jgi:hypothetical protein
MVLAMLFQRKANTWILFLDDEIIELIKKRSYNPNDAMNNMHEEAKANKRSLTFDVLF